jgi:hypothetical protein
MKQFLSFAMICIALTITSCKEKTHEHHHDEASDAMNVSGNEALYNEVMKIHDEVMPKLEDIHRKKEELNNTIASTPNMKEDQKQVIQGKIARLDSASESMMDWMHQFNPLPDSTGEEKAKEYLENQMEKVKKVRENIESALKDN